MALKWVLPETQADQARRLRNDFQKETHELLAPDVFPIEIAHALTRAERKKIIPTGYAKGFLLFNIHRRCLRMRNPTRETYA